MSKQKNVPYKNFKRFLDGYLLPRILYNSVTRQSFTVGKNGPSISQDFGPDLHWIVWWDENFIEANSIFKTTIENKNKRFKEINYSIRNNEITIFKKHNYRSTKSQKIKGAKPQTQMTEARQAGNQSLGS